MSAREELLAHAKRIEDGELTWVPGTPHENGQCCVGYWHDESNMIRVGRGAPFDAETRARGDREGFSHWNDRHCKDATEAVEFLRAVAARCPE